MLERHKILTADEVEVPMNAQSSSLETLGRQFHGM